MACLNPDGTLTRSAEAVLAALHESATEQQIVEHAAVPRLRVRSLLRDMAKANLIAEDEGVYRLSADGEDLPATVS